MLIDQKKYQIVICDCDGIFIESFLDADMDAVVKQTAQYKMEKIRRQVSLLYFVNIWQKSRPN